MFILLCYVITSRFPSTALKYASVLEKNTHSRVPKKPGAGSVSNEVETQTRQRRLRDANHSPHLLLSPPTDGKRASPADRSQRWLVADRNSGIRWAYRESLDVGHPPGFCRSVASEYDLDPGRRSNGHSYPVNHLHPPKKKFFPTLSILNSI